MMRGFGEHLLRMSVAYAMLLISLLLTLAAFFYVRDESDVQNEVRFNEATSATQEAITRRTDSYVDIMLGARGIFTASETVTQEEWKDFVGSIEPRKRYAGLQTIGYAEYVTPGDREDFLNRRSLELKPDLDPNGERTAYFPVTYVEPQDPANDTLFGRDFYAETVHRAAMDGARDSGAARATSVVYVLGEAPENSPADLSLRPGFAVYLPVYVKGEPASTVAERRKALEGFVLATFKMEALLREVSKGAYDPQVDFEVYDGSGLSADQLLYDDDGILRAGDTEEDSLLNRESSIEVAGREWSLYFTALPEFRRETTSRLPLFVLLVGTAVSLLLFGVSRMLVRSRFAAEQATRDLEASNNELEAANRELEAFSHSVSHDLRAPLRSIDGFSQIVLEDYADKLDEEGRGYLNRVRAASQRMGALIDDLLNLSRVTRSMLRREAVDLSGVAEDIARNLKEPEPDRDVEVVVWPGLRARGDARLLRVALENLLGNAWKFTSRTEGARIEFGVERGLASGNGHPVYFVRDNGAGFEMAYADKLFGAFQRLHGPEEFEGTGIGLATVQRVVRRHGGDVWAEGVVGEGAVFYFTLEGGPRPRSKASPVEAGAV